MKIVDPENTKENWHEVLSSWSKVVNWSHYNFSDLQLRQQIKPLIIYLWNEKDWIKKRHPDKAKAIEAYVNNSKYIKIIADLANSIKHGGLARTPRSDSRQLDYFGQIRFGSGKSRKMYYIESSGKHFELFEILRGAIEEYESLELQCRF
jgi:hypothetical protein